jgi:hypothetical protein
MSSLLIIHWFDKTLSNDINVLYVCMCCFISCYEVIKVTRSCVVGCFDAVIDVIRIEVS